MSPEWDKARRVLCIRLDSIGDMLMTSPALRAVKESGSRRHVTVLTSEAGAGMARLITEVDDVISFPAPWMKAASGTPDLDLALIRRLAEGQFDAAIIFTVYSQSPLPAAYACYLAGVPRVLAHCRENPYQLLSDWVRDPEPEALVRHEVRRQLDLVAAIGCRPRHERLAFRVPPATHDRIAALLDGHGVTADTPLVVAHPGASAASRRYPPGQFAEALRLIATNLRARIVLTGSSAETELTESIGAAVGARASSVAGQLELAELGALIDAADLVISNNTAPAHIAAAMNTPVVDLYARTNPQHTPWQVACRVLSHEVPCGNCYRSVCPEGHHDCLRLVLPHEIADAAAALLSGAAPEAPASHLAAVAL